MISLVDFDGWRVRVPTSPHPWPSKSLRRASVNSLGIGGSTAHAVVEFYEPKKITNGVTNGVTNGANGIHKTNGTNGLNGVNGVNGTNDVNGIHEINGNNGAHHVNGVNGSKAIDGVQEVKGTTDDKTVNGSHETEQYTDKAPFLVFTSGASRDSRDKNTLNLLEFLKSHDECRTLTGPLIAALNARSNIHIRPWKSFAVASSVDDLIQQLENKALKSNQAPRSGGVPQILFTFTGQGAMWSQMGKRLLEAFPVARNTLNELDQVIKELQSSKTPTWSLIGTFDLPT